MAFSYTCIQCHSSIKHNKRDEFTELCVSSLFKFKISCHCKSIFVKFSINLVMPNVYYYQHIRNNSTYIILY